MYKKFKISWTIISEHTEHSACPVWKACQYQLLSSARDKKPYEIVDNSSLTRLRALLLSCWLMLLIWMGLWKHWVSAWVIVVFTYSLGLDALLILLLLKEGRCSQTLLLLLVFFRRSLGRHILKGNNDRSSVIAHFSVTRGSQFTSLLLCENVLMWASEWSPFTRSPEILSEELIKWVIGRLVKFD